LGKYYDAEGEEKFLIIWEVGLVESCGMNYCDKIKMPPGEYVVKVGGTNLGGTDAWDTNVGKVFDISDASFSIVE